MNKISTLLSLTPLLLLSACASKLSTESPASVDLSGTWVLNETYSQEVVIQRQGGGERGGRGQGGGRGEGGRGPGGGRGGERGGERGGRDNSQGGERNRSADRGRERGAKKTPAMTAKEITITQNTDSMGIAYPKNNYRDIDWGKTELWNSTVEAGWNKNNILIIETEGERSSFTESYQLDPKSDILVLMIDTSPSQNGGEYRRVFTRKTTK